MNMINKQKNCPVCNNKVEETARFCSNCGARIAEPAVDSLWLAGIHERIRHARANDIYYTAFAMLGAVTAIAIPFIMRFVLLYNMDPLSWTLTGVGLLFFFGGYAGILYDDKKVKELINELETGPQAEEETEAEGDSEEETEGQE